MIKNYNIPSIKHWAFEDRPREKLTLKGSIALSDSELLAIIIGSGSKEESAVALAKRILKHCNNDLNNLAKLEIADLQKFKGVGLAKSTVIMAVMELARRKLKTNSSDMVKITSSRIAYEALYQYLIDLKHEEFWIILLNQANTIIAIQKICTGGINQTLVDIRLIFQKALSSYAVGIILAHNHPSGQLKPSKQDISLTKKIIESGKLMNITILDHLIISQQGYLSFADEGILDF